MSKQQPKWTEAELMAEFRRQGYRTGNQKTGDWSGDDEILIMRNEMIQAYPAGGTEALKENGVAHLTLEILPTLQATVANFIQQHPEMITGAL